MFLARQNFELKLSEMDLWKEKYDKMKETLIKDSEEIETLERELRVLTTQRKPPPRPSFR